MPILERMGFERDRNTFSGSDYEVGAFEKNGAWGQHRIVLSAVDRRPEFYGVKVDVSSSLFVLAQAWYEDQVIDTPYISRAPRSTTYLTLQHWLGAGPVPLHALSNGGAGIPFTDERQIAPVISLLSRTAARKLPRLLRPLETLQGYDAVYCTVPLSASPYFTDYLDRCPLLCAELVGNPRLLAICDEVAQALESLADPEDPMRRVHIGDMRLHLQRIRERSLKRGCKR